MHLNNFVFLVFSYCTNFIYQLQIPVEGDGPHEAFLKWTLYGNIVIYSMLLVFSFLYHFSLLDCCADFITRKCGGPVCITINTFGVIGGIYLFDFVTMVYAVYVYFFEKAASSPILQLFTMVCAHIFLVWLLLSVLWLFKKLYYSRYPPTTTDYYGIPN